MLNNSPLSLSKPCLITLLLSSLQWQPELQQSGNAGAAEAAGEAEGGGGGDGAQRGGAGQPAHPAGHGPKEPQQTVPGLAGLGVDLRGGAPPASGNSCGGSEFALWQERKSVQKRTTGKVKTNKLALKWPSLVEEIFTVKAWYGLCHIIDC